MRTANFGIEVIVPNFILIRDLGPWDECPTVTNDAEGVVKRLLESGKLEVGDRLFYFDSEGEFGELLIKDGAFAGFGKAVFADVF